MQKPDLKRDDIEEVIFFSFFSFKTWSVLFSADLIAYPGSFFSLDWH